MFVNVDHVHLIIKYLPRYLVGFITKKIEGRNTIHNLERMAQRSPTGLMDIIMATVRSLMGSCGEIYRDARIACAERGKRHTQALYLSAGYSDFGRVS